ncbi:hypothetical protein M2266_003438 [Streptomyces sp. SPB162]|nr:hypothetical protein [Streptomyces sp. SPB162]
MDYYNNRSGCARPLYRNAAGTLPNLAPGLLSLITERLGVPLTPEDLLAYIAAVASHPDYSARFKEDLEVPGARIPLTADPRLWEQAVGIGRRVLWLHTYGERYADDAAGRPYGRVLLPRDRPRCVEEIPDDPEAMPEKLEYDPVTQDLWIGAGRISPVPRTVREYEVSGMNVLDKWFGYRRRIPPVNDASNWTAWSLSAGSPSGPLNYSNCSTSWACSYARNLHRPRSSRTCARAR